MPDYLTFIIDDEPDAGQLLANLLADFPVLNIAQVFTDASKALDAVIQNMPAVIFLDIEMPVIGGIEFLQKVNAFSPKTKVIFVTAYEDYALEALHNDAFDLLCKPVSREELRRVVHKLIGALNHNQENLPKSDTRILLKTADGHHYISVDEVLFLEADSNYTYVVMKDNRKLLSSVNLGRVQEIFPRQEFVRISRKHIIHKDFLTYINFNKRYCIVSHNGDEYKLEITAKNTDLKTELGI